MPTGLLRRGARYYIRRRIPAELIKHYGRSEITRALGTSEAKEARRLLPQAWVALTAEFDQAGTAAQIGQPYAAPNAVALKPLTSANKAEGAKPCSAMTIRDVQALWAKHQDRPASTIRSMDLALDRFERVMGNRVIGSVTRQDVGDFIDKMRTPGVVTSQGISVPNMNALLAMVSALFGFAVRRNLIPANPASNTLIPDARRPREKRREFDEPALEAIFSSPVYAQGARPKGGAGEAAYWIPLLALYTGARIGELCQLHPQDVTQEGYVDAKGEPRKEWVIRIEQNAARSQRVKTESSERRIPVHADLIALGFLRYVEGQAGQPLLFDQIKSSNREGRLSLAWGQWFSDYLRNHCGVTDARMTFHSFRHSFKHYARQALIPADVHNALTGHETGSAADAYGGLSFPLHPLVEGMKRYRVPDFKLPPAPALSMGSD